MIDRDFKDQLRAAYDTDANRRTTNSTKRSDWKIAARQQFADTMKREKKRTILEIGAGVGTDSKFFQEQGFEILATDLSPKMVEACKELGLNAQVLDIYELDRLNQKFDAIYSLNVLLHIPPQDLAQVLATIGDSLQPNGLFYYGVYGGTTKEETHTDPSRMNMPRYFSFLDDASLLKVISPVFSVVSSDVVDMKGSQGTLHFQSLLLRKK